MNIFWSKNFIIGIIYIAVVSGCSVKNIETKDVKENTSDVNNELSSEKNSSLEKGIELEDKPSLANEEKISEETMINGGFRNPSTPNKHSNPFLAPDKSIQKSDSNKSNQKISRANFNTDAMLNSIFFDYDKYSLSKAAKNNLIKNADWLKKDPSLIVQLEGHCDERGTNNYNLALGEKRAHKVKRELEILGIDKNRMITVSYGEEKPFCPESKESCWSQNRRVQFLIKIE